MRLGNGLIGLALRHLNPNDPVGMWNAPDREQHGHAHRIYGLSSSFETLKRGFQYVVLSCFHDRASHL